MRCQACQNIPLSIFLDVGEYDHSDSYEHLKEKATECDLCSLLLVYMDDVLESRAPEYVDELRKSEKKIYLEHVDCEPFRTIQLKFRGLKDDDLPELRFHSAQLPPKESEWMWEQKADHLKPLRGETDSPECFKLAKHWIRSCLKKHPACRRASSGWLPTRVIEVGTADRNPCLRVTSDHISNSQGAYYLALSHCWGKPPHNELHMTKMSTLSARLEEIPFGTLPKTFQDAVDIARNLQVPYLWIDTFCILQDSKEDWEREAASMAKVYNKALCTIAASSSTNWMAGCFTLRNKFRNCSCNLFWPKSKDGNFDEDISLTIFPPLPSDTLDTCPLSQRAWTLQERRLSRRVLHYTNIELKWECRSWAASESSLVGDALIPLPGHKVFGHETDSHEQWRKTIKEYSKRQLTYWTDRLTALSGLAMRTKMAMDSEQYLAGLWRGDLLRDLLWYRPKALEQHKQSSEYLAPTWSWASRIGTVVYPVFRTSFGKEYIYFESGPTVLAAETTAVGKDAFGQISSGSLRLSGCLRKAVAKTGKKNHLGTEFGFRFELPLSAEESERTCGNFTFDFEAQSSSEPMYLLRMATLISPEPECGPIIVMGLLPTGRVDEEYERCGLGEIYDTHWFDESEEQNITVV